MADWMNFLTDYLFVWLTSRLAGRLTAWLNKRKTECSSLMKFLAWKSSWSFSWENGLHIVAAFMISWLARQPNVMLSSDWPRKLTGQKGWFLDQSWWWLLVERLIKPIDWMTHYWLQNCLSDNKLLVCDFGRLHVCAILFLYLLRNWWVHFKSLLLFHSSTEKKQAHNEEIPGKC